MDIIPAGCELSKLSYQCEEDEETSDVSEHATQGNLQRAQNLEGWHEVGSAGDAQHVSHGEQDVRHNLRVIRLPRKPSCKEEQ